MVSRNINSKPSKVTRARIDTIAEKPLVAMLNIQTDQGPVRLLIDGRNALQLMEECLKMLGYPAPTD